MRKVISIHQLSLDGVIQAPGGPEEDRSGGFSHGGWAANFIDETFRDELGKLMTSEFDLLLGRRTYEIWNAYWPYQDNEIGRPFNKATKYVATNTLDKLEWKTSVKLDGDAAEGVRKLKSTDGPDLHIWGSSKLVQSLVAKGLIDELRLWIFPIIIGEGKRLFENGLPASSFELVKSETTKNGLIYSTYRPAGPLVTGNLAGDDPTDAEIERRKEHNL